jgi:hypothetical protein
MGAACVMKRRGYQRAEEVGRSDSPRRREPPLTGEPERFPVALRAYVTSGPPKKSGNTKRKKDAGPSEWSLVFDAETTIDPSQRLRFGSYQVRNNDDLSERGLFYDPDVLLPDEQATLRQYAQEHELSVRTRVEFIEDIFFGVGYDFLANIIGFNLPFDISRLAESHDSSRNRRGSWMSGGFTFRISPNKWRPRVVIMHHSASLAFIRFAGDPTLYASRSSRKRGEARIRRGYFLDLRTAAKALTSQLHSLESLTISLGVAQKKRKSTEHGKTLTSSYIAYAVQDVNATWECYVALRERYKAHQLRNTPLNSIYSEASLGKAYLEEMGVVPWRDAQPDFPPEILGNIMSAFFGGRAEVHLRRLITQVLYCDFTSMYPTVCTLMGLWEFVVSKGMSHRDSTEETRLKLKGVAISDLQNAASWRGLRTIVQVQPEADLFPVRARYGDAHQYTIGLNYLTSDFPMWFTLADCIASKLLTGKAPKVLKALTFEPLGLQSTLWPANIMGNTDYRVDPSKDDFYGRLIDLRMAVRQRGKRAGKQEAAKIETEQLALKILANATSYGIFVELNVEELRAKRTLRRYGVSGKSEPVSRDKIEEPGRYFHPLLGGLITGAARLMLAIAEARAAELGIDWAFCDTDSMALAKSNGMSEADFYSRALTICSWFKPLNPYSNDVDIFKIENENRPIKDGKLVDGLEPLFCYGVSAKRYALFNLSAHGSPVLRKTSAHGLGHWLPPYGDEKAPKAFPEPAIELKAVKRWQHDIWHRIVTSALADSDTNSNPAAHPAFDRPVASQYHATKPFILNWFKAYNKTRRPEQQVGPFNFLLSFQAHALARQADQEPAATGRGHRDRGSAATMRPVAAYNSDLLAAAKTCFDRMSGGAPVSINDLATYREALAQYHLYPESKFLNGRHRDRGPTQRRHVKIGITDIHYIGKEANELEEQVFFGFDPEAQPEYGMEDEAYPKLLAEAKEVLKVHRLTTVSAAVGVSARYLREIRDGAPKVRVEILKKIERAMPALEVVQAAEGDRARKLLDWARAERDRIGLRMLAGKLRTDPSNLGKVLEGSRRASGALLASLCRLVPLE